MKIGEVASAAGVSTRALRYYEEQGLLSAERSPAGQRRYDVSAVERVRWIQRLYAAGISSSVVAELLPCVSSGVATARMLQRLTAHRDRLDAQIRELAETRERLDAVMAAAPQR